MDMFDFIDVAVVFAAAVLCGMGVGGGGLPVIYLTLCRGMPQLEAQGLNLVFFIVSAAASVLTRKISRGELALSATLGLCGAVGSLFGSRLAHSVDVGYVRLAFGGLLIVGALMVFRGQKISNKNSFAP